MHATPRRSPPTPPTWIAAPLARSAALGALLLALGATAGAQEAPPAAPPATATAAPHEPALERPLAPLATPVDHGHLGAGAGEARAPEAPTAAATPAAPALDLSGPAAPPECALPAGDRFADHPAPPTSGAVTLVVLHTNDLHGQAYPQRALWLAGEDPPEAGGFSALASLIRREREAAREAGEACLLLDAGDIWQGTPEGNETGGRLPLAWMGLVGYDAGTLGEHDFDAGAEAVEPLFKLARFPVLVANLVRITSRAPPEFVRPALDRVLAGGLRVSVVGVMATDTKLVSSPRATVGFDWNDAIETVREQARLARERGAEVVLVLSHAGPEEDVRIAAAVPGVDAVIGGRSHRAIDPPFVDPRTGAVVVSTWSKGSTLGRLALVYDRASRHVTTQDARILDVFTASLPKDPPTEELLAAEAAPIHARHAEVLGEALAPIRRRDGHEASPLGTWVADLVRAAGEAEVAIHNKSGLRADIAKGPIRFRDLYQVSPFANKVVVLDLSGDDIRDALEHALSDPRYAVEVSGLEVRYDLDRPPGERVVRLRVGGAPLEPARRYRVATNSFLAGGGDGFVAFLRAASARTLDADPLRLHADDVRRRGKVSPSAEPRVAPAEMTAPGTMPGG
jgi:2',3'-cyclic-nucleotide 2'-phosphodiesterase (5'-nucleotidase family)